MNVWYFFKYYKIHETLDCIWQNNQIDVVWWWVKWGERVKRKPVSENVICAAVSREEITGIQSCVYTESGVLYTVKQPTTLALNSLKISRLINSYYVIIHCHSANSMWRVQSSNPKWSNRNWWGWWCRERAMSCYVASLLSSSIHRWWPQFSDRFVVTHAKLGHPYSGEYCI